MKHIYIYIYLMRAHFSTVYCTPEKTTQSQAKPALDLVCAVDGLFMRLKL